MRTVLAFIFLIGAVTCAIVFFYRNSVGERPSSEIAQQSTFRTAILLPEQPQLVKIVNSRNTQITNFACPKVDVKVWQGGRRFRLTASLYYEKNNKFRLIASSILGKEIDVGSNESLFWYWGKRMRSSALNYARHEDLNKVRMKTPFTPKWMMASFGLDVVDASQSKTVDLDDKFILVDQLRNASGAPITKMTYLSKKEKKISGYLVLDSDNKKIVSGEVLEWKNDIPKQILYVWFEENVSLLMDFSGAMLNVVIDPRYWQLPDITPQVNLAP